jgi:MoaA/NifB/PqqE/SkfB family radical SAM enzyme
MNGHYILKLNNRCNMNCIFCADPSNVRRLPDPDLSEIFRGIKENREIFDSLIITGGEPTIYEDIIKVLKYSKKYCRYSKICIVTNGTVLSNKSNLRKINEFVDSYQISYFASDEKTHLALSRTPDSYKMVVLGIKNAVETKKEVRINVVINKLNYTRLPEVVDQLIRWKVSSITLSFMNPSGDSVQNGKSSVGISYSEVMPYIKRSFEKAARYTYNQLYIENFPLCIGQEFIDKITDVHKPKENEEYYSNGKCKIEICNRCSKKKECDGFWSAYLRQFPTDDIKPFMEPRERKRAETKELTESGQNVPTSSYLDNLFEIAGLDIGIKKASIIYSKKAGMDEWIKKLVSRGFHVEISDFCYIHKDEKTVKVEHPSDDGEYSIYFSKDKRIIKRLKYLDYYHQFKKREPNGLTGRDLFYEIGEILGYPKCCSDFLLSCHEENYEKLVNWSNGEYSDETIYKMLAIRQESEAFYHLNNFSINHPLFGFYVCSYKCENVRNISKKIIDYLKEKHPDKYATLLKQLKKPILFFSAYRILVFDKAEKKNGRIIYSEMETDQCAMNQINSEKRIRFDRIIQMFKEGDSFTVEDKLIRIYKKNKLVHVISKKHRYDGIYIEFI